MLGSDDPLPDQLDQSREGVRLSTGLGGSGSVHCDLAPSVLFTERSETSKERE